MSKTQLRKANRALRARVGIKTSLFNNLCVNCKNSFVRRCSRMGLTTYKKERGLTERVNKELEKALKKCRRKHN